MSGSMAGANGTDIFDYVIVGAGSAGSVLANRLTEDGTATVCVLEAGPRDWNPFIHIPAGFMKTLVNPSVNWLYRTEAGPGIGGRNIPSQRRKVPRGSGLVHGPRYNPGHRMDHDGRAPTQEEHTSATSALIAIRHVAYYFPKK